MAGWACVPRMRWGRSIADEPGAGDETYAKLLKNFQNVSRGGFLIIGVKGKIPDALINFSQDTQELNTLDIIEMLFEVRI